MVDNRAEIAYNETYKSKRISNTPMKKPPQTLANRDIRHMSVRLVTEDGSKVLPTNHAIEQAERAGLDLVMINEQADPPICKITDLGKFLYEHKIKEKEAARAQRAGRITIKEVQFKPNIDEHDFEVKCRNIAKFIGKGNLVKVQVQFRGRERQHTEIGFELIDRVIESVDNIAIDGKPQFSGNRITAMIKGTDGT